MNIQVAKQKPQKSTVLRRTISDVVAPPSKNHTVRSTNVTAKKSAPLQSPEARKSPASAAQAVKRHKQQAPSTLMRRAVKKPDAQARKRVAVAEELLHPSPQPSRTHPSAAHRIDHARLQRASNVPKNSAVNRFHAPKPIPIIFTRTPVKTAPKPAVESPAATPAPITAPDIFEQAIANATHYVDIAAHKAVFKKKARRHAVSMGAGTLALLLLMGFAAYLHMPNIQAKVAGLRAGVVAAAPNFSAAGFSLSGIESRNARLTYGFHDKQSQYRLTEQPTNWDSQDMIQHVAALNADGTQDYQTVSADAQTVYRLGKTQATWVKDGTWYHVHGADPLTDNQLRSLVRNS